MGYILFIDSTVRPAGVSRTLALAGEFFSEYKRLHPEKEIRVRRLMDMGLAPHTAEGLEKRDRLLAKGETGGDCFALAREFAGAEKIVVAAPFWDLTFPAYFKIYIENISVCGITFGFDGRGMYGMCRCEKLLYITTRGGDYSGADSGLDCALPLLRAYSKMFALGRVDCVAAQGIDIAANDQKALLCEAAERARAMAREF